MNIAKLSEQLKDVPQAKLIDYAKNPNSVVPQFLALAEIQRRQQLQKAAPDQAPQSSVAEDIMAQEPRMQGVAQLPTRAMFTEQGMASGGIVAFAEGGDAEDEYEELLEKNRRSRLQGMQEALAEIGGYLKNPLARIENMPARAQRRAEQEVASEPRKGSHKYEDLVLAEAQRQGIDPSLARHVLYKETGNIANPENVRSKAGAIGIMQLMPKTAKELGVDPTDPEQNIRGGITYLRKMMDKYNDPVLAAAAYNAGPGRVDKALKGEGLTALPRETRMYIAGLAEGGEVKRYQVGGELEAFSPPDYSLDELRVAAELEKRKKREEAEREEFLKEAAPQLAKKEPKAKPAPTTAKTEPVVAETKPQFTYPPQGGIGPTRAEMGADVPEAPKSATAQTYFDALLKNIEEQATAAKKAGDENKALAIMQAGFGMMASKSPYALTGIGEGAMTGVGTYAGLRKGEREDERSLMAARLGLTKAKSAQEESEALREANKLYREQSLGLRAGELEQRTISNAVNALNNFVNDRERRIIDRYKGQEYDPKAMAARNAEIEAIKRDPTFIELYKRAYPDIGVPTSSPAPGGGERKPLSYYQK